MVLVLAVVIPPPRAFMLTRCQKLLRFQRRHAALPGGGHRLPVDVVGHVAGGEDAGTEVVVELPPVTM